MDCVEVCPKRRSNVYVYHSEAAIHPLISLGDSVYFSVFSQYVFVNNCNSNSELTKSSAVTGLSLLVASLPRYGPVRVNVRYYC